VRFGRDFVGPGRERKTGPDNEILSARKNSQARARIFMSRNSEWERAFSVSLAARCIDNEGVSRARQKYCQLFVGEMARRWTSSCRGPVIAPVFASVPEHGALAPCR